MLPAQANQFSVPSLLDWNPAFNGYSREVNRSICEKTNSPMYQDFRYRQGYRRPPWEEMPPEARRFQKQDSLAIASIVDDTDTTVLEFIVPTGSDAVIATVVNIFSPGGIVQATGEVEWSIIADQTYIRDYGSITVELGGLNTPYAIEGGWIRVYSEQTVRYNVKVTAAGRATLDPTGFFVCSFAGWYWPRRELKVSKLAGRMPDH